MQYIYNSRTGMVMYYSSLVIPEMALLHSGLGWHGPFDSREAVTKYYNDNKAKNPGWKAPSGNPVDALKNTPNAVNDQTDAALKGAGLNLSDQAIQSWMIRIGEILLGIVLIGVGIAKLTGTTNAIAGLVKAKI